MAKRLLLALVPCLLCASAQAEAPQPAAPVSAARLPVALLVDLGSGATLYARNPGKRFLPASMTKAMTAYTAFGLLAEGKLSASQTFRVSQATALQWSGQGTSLHLAADSEVPVDVLIRGITTVSANDAAVVLAEGFAGSVPAWIEAMNRDARALGMTDSHFATPNGWPDGGATQVTARDLIALGSALVDRYPALYRRYFGQKQLTWNGITQFNKDPVTGVVVGADGIKTGHTAEAGYNFLGSAERGGRRLMLVVAGAASEAERAEASRGLLEWGFSAWKTRPLFGKGQAIARARVQEGDARHVELTANRAVYATLPPGGQGRVAMRLIYRGPLKAPIAAGLQVAELEVTADGMTGRVPLFAAESVGEAGPFDRLINGLVGFIS